MMSVPEDDGSGSVRDHVKAARRQPDWSAVARISPARAKCVIYESRKLLQVFVVASFFAKKPVPTFLHDALEQNA
jgi:hypothetical protein